MLVRKGLASSRRPSASNTKILVILGAAALLFLVLWVVALVQSAASASDAKTAKQQGIAAGQSSQAKEDETKLNTLVNSPSKTYVAPAIYGGLEVSYPKTWNAQVTENGNGTSLSLSLNPSPINTAPGTSFAARLTLSQALLATVVRPYQDRVKRGTVKSQSITVSGITATRFDGKLDDRKDSAVVFIPVRDKVIAVYCDDTQYLPEFKDIIDQLKVNP